MNTEIKPDSAPEKVPPNTQTDELQAYVLKRYEDSINYYWKNAGINKRTYRRNRSMIIILGATVTLLSSLISASFIEQVPWLKTAFAIVAPASAAVLTMITGFTQSFQSGAAWRDMVLNAERLEKERDRFIATPENEKDYRKELDVVNTIIVNESTAFFKRILDSEYEPEAEPDND
jgi:hypothetical protein